MMVDKEHPHTENASNDLQTEVIDIVWNIVQKVQHSMRVLATPKAARAFLENYFAGVNYQTLAKSAEGDDGALGARHTAL
mmetsp:Transcript_34692/g.64230  ORF Transcript_34692/g.64230 Transcript_34692/m.64230 type:complete len:80 (-) Transcript_34692:196-435(-)